MNFSGFLYVLIYVHEHETSPNQTTHSSQPMFMETMFKEDSTFYPSWHSVHR